MLHALHLAEAHVMADERENLIGLVVREAQTMADFGRHLDSDLDMAIEANAIGRNAKGRRLPTSCSSAPQARVFDAPAGSFSAAATCARTRRLRDDIAEAARLPSWPRFRAGLHGEVRLHRAAETHVARSLRQHLGQLFAHALAGDLVNLRG